MSLTKVKNFRSCVVSHFIFVSVTLLAVGIPLLAESAGNVSSIRSGGKRGSDFDNGQLALAIQPLFDLLTRYAPSLSHLTTIHSVFLRVSLMLRLSPTFIQ